MPGARRRRRPHTAWMDNIKMWTGLPMEESIRMTDDRDKWKKYVHGVANPWIEDGYRTEQANSAYRGWKTVTMSRLLYVQGGSVNNAMAQHLSTNIIFVCNHVQKLVGPLSVLNVLTS